MYVGQHGPKTRTPDKAITDAVEAFMKKIED